ncbi:MAG: Na+/H+ antiporter NhaA [Saprospiraceae bacterium]|nr:Na+/H+ antiporter NhaA [Saprospiraceae bacterium]
MDIQPKQIVSTITTPFRQFIRTESASGLLLMFCAAGALIWANSGLADSYFSIWETPVSISVGDSSLSKPLLLWVNDGLMAIFFFMVGLEIKREVLYGELSTPRKSALPLVAALGGMIVPVGLFFALHGNEPGVNGWGIPMATDIAFSIGVLYILGSRVPLGMKVFLTAFAIVDDIGAVLVIALFYSHEMHWEPLAISAALMLVLVLCNWILSIKRNWVYVTIGAGVWYYLLKSGVHPTIAGVLVALTIPATNRIRLRKLRDRFRERIEPIFQEKDEDEEVGPILPEEELKKLKGLKSDVKNVQPPLQRMEYLLSDFVAFFVMPMFALANAGVAITGGFEVFQAPLTQHIAIGLVVGKLLGILSFSWLAVRLELADLPPKCNWINMAGLSLLGGIGFTMALFISNLSLEQSELIRQAKLGILFASVTAGFLGLTILRLSLPAEEEEGEEKAEEEMEMPES